MEPRYRTTAAERRKYEEGLVEGTGRGGTGLFDTWGMTDGLFGLGGKAKDVQQILDDPSTKYTPGQGYNLNWWQRNVSKITDQDIANARFNREREALETKFGDDAEKYGIDIKGTTSRSDLSTQLETAKAIKEKKDELSGFGSYGAAAKAELGLTGSLTPTQLNAAIVRAQELKTAADPVTQATLARQTAETESIGTRDSIAQQQANDQRDHNAGVLALQGNQFEYTKKRDFDNEKTRQIERAEDRISAKEERQDQIRLRMYEIDELNKQRNLDREYRRKLDKQEDAKELVEALTALTTAFTL